MACSSCSSCPPCETPLPVTCEPLEQSPTIQRLVGEDSASCKVTLINPVVAGLLYLDGDGAIGWRTGAADSPINLTLLQDSGAAFTSLAVIEPDGDLAFSKPTYVATEKWHIIAQSNSVSWVEEKNIFGSGSGILRKDFLSPFGFSWLTGNAGQLATVDSFGNVVFQDAAVVIPANAYPDRVGYTAYRTGTKTIDINFQNFIVLDSSGANALGVVNTSVKTLTLTTNGANGLDTGSLASASGYYVFVIYNPTSGTIAVLASLSATAPTMPAGYTYKRRVGYFRTEVSAADIPAGYNQGGNIVRFGNTGEVTIYTKTGGATSGFASGAISSYISTDYADEALFRAGQRGPANSGELNVFIAEAAGSNLAATINTYGGMGVTASQANKSYATVFSAQMPIGITSYYNVFYSGMTNGSDAIILTLAGYSLKV